MTRAGTPVDFVRAAAAGVVGTGTMTALWMVEPSIGLPKIAVGHILSTFMSVSVAHLKVGNGGGWIAHLAFGGLLALLYARFVAARVPGAPLARGALYGALLFIVAQMVFMPLVGGGSSRAGTSNCSPAVCSGISCTASWWGGSTIFPSRRDRSSRRCPGDRGITPEPPLTADIS